MKALLVGYGRMGHAIEEVLVARGHEVASRLTSSAGEAPGPGASIAFEFTGPGSAPKVLPLLAEAGIATVSGTTGWEGTERIAALFAERGVPFVRSPNFSVGVNLMFRIAELLGTAAARMPSYEGGLCERHHSRKKDAPSGTAAEIARRYGARAGREIPVVSLRQGGQPGEHRLILEGPEESLEVVHRARSPRLFAEGAVMAGEWLLASGRRGPVPFDDFVESLLAGGRT